MSDLEFDVSIDVDVWASYEKWSYIDAEYLVLGFDPHKLEQAQNFEFTPEQDDTRRRLRRILDGFRERTAHKRSMPPAEMFTRLERLGHTFPSDLVDAVRNAEEPKPEIKAERRESDIAKELQSARRIILALGATRFGFRPDRNNSAAATMCRATESVGLRVDDDTIRSILKKTYAELDQKQKSQVKEVAEKSSSEKS